MSAPAESERRMNSSQGLFFVLGAYSDMGLLRHLYFFLVMILYVFILGSNLLLVVVICLNRSLHEPMYMFLCSLFVNELFGSTGLYPFLLLHILSHSHTVSHTFCFLQVFLLYTYGSVQFSNLAIMSYDRFLAIVHPLQYSRRMTPRKVALLVALTWLYPVWGILILIALSSSLQLCGNVIPEVYCANYSIVKLACGDTTVNNVYGLSYTCSLACFTILIFYSYTHIFKVCFSGSTRTRQKAVSTCTPHLLSLFNFSFGCFFEIVQSRFTISGVPHMLSVFLSLYWLAWPPLFNPLLYGLNLGKIRKACKSWRCLSSD